MASEKRRIAAPVTVLSIPIFIFFAIFFAVPSLSEDLFGVSVKKGQYSSVSGVSERRNTYESKASESQENAHESDSKTNTTAPDSGNAEQNTAYIKAERVDFTKSDSAIQNESQSSNATFFNLHDMSKNVRQDINEIIVDEEARKRAYDFLNDLNTQI